MSFRDEDDPFEEDIVFDQAGLLSTSRKSSKSAIRRVSSGKCAMFSKTLGLCGAFLGLGLTFAIPGPLSPLPPTELRGDISLMSYEIMYRCQGFMIGAMFGARLLDRFNRLFLVFLALLVTALLVTIIPWCGIVWLLRTDMFLLGATLGFLSTGGNVLCLDLWGRNSGPFMQALHFSFSLGVFLAPFLSQPLMVSISYATRPPTTTPAIFPLHRLPRDVGSITPTAIVNGSAPFLNTTASTYYHDLLTNNSWASVAASTLSSSSVASPTSETNHQVSSGVNSSYSPLNTSLYNSSPSLGVKGTATPVVPFSSSPQDPSSSSTNVSSSQPSRGNVSTVSTTPVSVSLHLSTQASQLANALNIDSGSTTTHRAPRPKPVLTNSEKLKDKNWENDKFRKPPPEDLVPLSTTMKPMVLSNSSTIIPAQLALNSTLSSALQKINSTSMPRVVVNPSILANLSKIIDNVNPNASSIPLVTSTPISSPLRTTSSVSPIPSTVAQAVASNATSGTPNVTSHFNFTYLSVPSSPATPVLSKKEEATSVKPSEDSVVQHDQKSQYVNKLETLKLPTMKYSTPLEEVPQNHTTEELALPMLEDPHVDNDSHVGKDENWHSDLSFYEQDTSSLNLTRVTSSFTEGSLRISQPDSVKHFTPETTLLLPTPRSQRRPVEHAPERSGMVQTKSSDNSPAKMTVLTKPLEKPDVLPARQEHDKSSTLSQKQPANMSTEGVSSTASLSVPVPTKNAAQVFESLSHVGLPVSPKHIHHSKPASTVVNDTEVTHTVIDAFANRLEKYGLSKMQLMYLTVGMVLLATSFLFLGFLCFNPRDPKSKTDEEEMNGSIARSGSRNRVNSGQTAPAPSRWLRHALIILMILILMITSGVQAMYGQLLLVYAMQSPLQLSQSTGSALTATFLGALTSTRFACILLASALSPTAMLVLSVSICSCATWLLSALATSSEVALWIGSVMVGVGTASVFPSGLLWMQRHVLITHRVAAMLVMGPAMGEMFFPTLAYKMMVSMGPASLVHLPALLSLFAIALWAAEWRLARYPRQSLCSNADESSGYQLANQHDEDDLLDLTMSPVINGNNTISRNGVRSYASGNSLHRMSA